MKEQRPGFGGVNVGTSSILIIFILLCLVTFATLSVVSARADFLLSQKSSDMVQNYYEASNQAEETALLIDEVLLNVWNTQTAETLHPSQEAYRAALLRANYPDSVTISRQEDGSIQFAYSVPAGESQSLSVVLSADIPRQGEPFYQVLCWKLSPTGEWKPEEELHVWNGQGTEDPVPAGKLGKPSFPAA